MYLDRLCGVALLVTVSSASAQEQRTRSDCAGLAANSVEAAIRSCHGEAVDPAEAALLGQVPVSEPPSFSDQPFDSMSGEAESFTDLSRAPTLLDDSEGTSPLSPSTARAGPLVQIDGENWASEQQRARSSLNDAADPSEQEVFWQAPPRLTPLTPTAEPHVEVDGQSVPVDDWLEGSLPDRPADPSYVEGPDGDLGSTLPPPTEAMRSAVIDGVTVKMDPVSYQLLELILRSSGVADTKEALTVQPEVLEKSSE